MPATPPKDPRNVPSLVMKLMNSLTHSCMHSFASLAILALSGRAVFMIRATGAKFRMLASDIAEGGDDEDEDARPPWWRRNDGEDCDDGRSKDMLEAMFGFPQSPPNGPGTAPVSARQSCDANHGLNRRVATNE